MTYGRTARALRLLGLVLLALAAGEALAAQGTGVAPSPPALGEVLRGVESKYNRMKSMKAHFQQIFRQGSQVRREEGMLYLSKPGKMRWEYENPEPKLFLTDGKRLILFVPSENRVMESAIKESADLRAPLAFLLGNLNFAEEFGRFETSPDLAAVGAGNIVFKAFPKRMGERLEWILFEVTPEFQIRRVVAREAGGIETEFRFTEEQSNPVLAQSLFRFVPPDGAEVVRE
ncbi:MAG TPA: outer membrane lipoprotein carrier protein LolA [Terriglobia bacterium]|jgi:outer membrane lipoprotein carrier protein